MATQKSMKLKAFEARKSRSKRKKTRQNEKQRKPIWSKKPLGQTVNGNEAKWPNI